MAVQIFLKLKSLPFPCYKGFYLDVNSSNDSIICYVYKYSLLKYCGSLYFKFNVHNFKLMFKIKILYIFIWI